MCWTRDKQVSVIKDILTRKSPGVDYMGLVNIFCATLKEEGEKCVQEPLATLIDDLLSAGVVIEQEGSLVVPSVQEVGPRQRGAAS